MQTNPIFIWINFISHRIKKHENFMMLFKFGSQMGSVPDGRTVGERVDAERGSSPGHCVWRAGV